MLGSYFKMGVILTYLMASAFVTMSFDTIAQPVCVGLDTKRDSIQAHWLLATNGDLPVEQRLNHFNKVFHFASLYPRQFPDTALSVISKLN